VNELHNGLKPSKVPSDVTFVDVLEDATVGALYNDMVKYNVTNTSLVKPNGCMRPTPIPGDTPGGSNINVSFHGDNTLDGIATFTKVGSN